MSLTVEQLYAAYGPAIYARCSRLLRDEVLAEDATQDIFIKLLRHADRLPDAKALLPWIHRITTNHCFNLLRDARRHPTPVEHVPEQLDDQLEDSIVSADFARHVLASTPEYLRRPAELYHSQGVDQQTVAQLLGVSRRTVLYRLAEFTRRVMRLESGSP